jgi:hypothetical protein
MSATVAMPVMMNQPFTAILGSKWRNGRGPLAERAPPAPLMIVVLRGDAAVDPIFPRLLPFVLQLVVLQLVVLQLAVPAGILEAAGHGGLPGSCRRELNQSLSHRRPC